MPQDWTPAGSSMNNAAPVASINNTPVDLTLENVKAFNALVSGAGNRGGFASTAALEAAYPAAANQYWTAWVGTTQYTSNGTAWVAVSAGGTTTTRIVNDYNIFQVELRTSTTPNTPDNANVTITFARNFELVTLQSSGLYAEVAHNTVGFAWVPGAGRSMLAGSSSALGLIYSAGNENRDLTLAAWVKTNATATKNATGINGTASAASSLTATAALATCLFTATAAALARTFQCWMQRRAGYGRVWMTGDNGVTWIDVSSQITTGAYTRVSIPLTGANPVLGFMLEVSGDAINVDSIACIGNAFPSSTAFITRSDMQGQTLTYAGARKATANPAFSVEYNWYFDNAIQGTVQLSGSGGSAPLLIAQHLANLPQPSAQVLTSAGTLYAGPPTIYYGANMPIAGRLHKYRLVFAGGSVFTYLDGKLTGINETVTPPSTLTISSMTELRVLPGIGNYASDVRVSDWLGRIVVGIGDSISVIESYRQNWLGALANLNEAVFQMKGVSGNTVAMVRDRIAADLALSLPAGNACTVVLWCGTNSLALGNTAPATLAELQQCITNILAINSAAKIIIPTTFTRRTGGLTGIDAASFTTTATAYNAGMSALTGVYKVVEMNDATSTAAGFFLADGIHPKGESYSAIVQKLAPWVA